MKLNDVIERISSADGRMILAKIGLEFEVIDDCNCIVNLGDYKAMFIYLDDMICLRASFEARVPLRVVNEWNSQSVFFRVYTLEENSLFYESFHLLKGGVTVSSIVQFIACFHSELARFVEKKL
jgi:hypothetical protein